MAYLQEHQVSLRQACLRMKLSASVYYYKAKVDPQDAPIQDELTRLDEEHRRWGFWKMFHYMRSRAMPWNHKRVYRIYTQLNLNIRRKHKKRLPSRTKESLYYILEKKLTTEVYHSLTVSDKARLLYLRRYVERHGFGRHLVAVIIEDRSFLVRIQVLKHLNEIDELERQGIILQLLNDKSSQVRLQTLYFLMSHSEKYSDSILKLTSDMSASVRDLARYLLMNLGLDFKSVYRDRIEKSHFTVGSILGLSEVGTVDDVGVLKSQMETEEDEKIKLACLTGIQKLDLQLAKAIAIKLFPNASNKIRKRCIEILSRTWDGDVLVQTEKMFEVGDVVLKRMILRLYNAVGGWDVLPQIIKATADLEGSVKELAWSFLQKWRERALRLFTRPSKEIIDKAKTYYGSINHDLAQIGESKQKLWNEINYYLKED